jgi:GH15 family glucan-1,4-alpha-glucosidase
VSTPTLRERSRTEAKPARPPLHPRWTRQGAIEQTAHEFAAHTCTYWQSWVRSLSLPFESYWSGKARGLRKKILKRAWNEDTGAFVGARDDPELDASVRRIAEIGLVPSRDPRFISTCDVVGRRLLRNGRIMRYTADDDFGAPETAFLACNFWYIEALAAIGRRDEAHDFFTGLLECRNSFGLLSEDIHPQTGALWGNFPQSYSMAGIINAAMRLSEKWEDVRCRVSS